MADFGELFGPLGLECAKKRVHSALCRVVYDPFPPEVVLGPTFTSGWWA